jgi:hypothetical protein
VSSRDVRWVAESEGLDIVEGSAPSGVGNQELDTVEGSASSETEEEPTCGFSIRRASNVGSTATWNGFAPIISKEKHRMMMTHLDLLEPAQRAAWGERP